jgi:hypothetical protein
MRIRVASVACLLALPVAPAAGLVLDPVARGSALNPEGPAQ